MSDTPNIGAAGPALAAHSKDAAAAGQTDAASSTGRTEGTGSSGGGGAAEVAGKWAGQARDAVGQAADNVSEMATNARRQIARRGSGGADEVMAFVREQPVAAVLTAGAVCLALGVLLGRR